MNRKKISDAINAGLKDNPTMTYIKPEATEETAAHPAPASTSKRKAKKTIRLSLMLSEELSKLIAEEAARRELSKTALISMILAKELKK